MLTVGAEKQDAGIDAFEDYMNTAFPTLHTKKQKRKDQMMHALKDWVGQGPLNVKPLGLPTRMRSRMVHRVAGIEKGLVNKVSSQVGMLRSR